MIPVIVGLICALLLNGCDIYSVSRSDQALGNRHGVDAWLDPALEPLVGCAALTGTWSNYGNKVRNRTVDPSVFTAAFGIADNLPDTVFADEVQLSYSGDTGLRILMLSGDEQTTLLQIPAKDIECSNPELAIVKHNGKRSLSVDASGALWTGEHRYPQPGTTACSEVGSWTYAAPNGMATIITGGTAILMEPAEPAQPIRVQAPITGVREAATAIYLLPGQHEIPVRVSFQPESEWDLVVPGATGQIALTAESCHVYAVLGFSDSVDVARLSVVDLGDHFDWRDCHPRENPYKSTRFDGQTLTARESCFSYGSDWRKSANAPPRVFATPTQVILRRTQTAEAEPQT